MKTKNWKSCVKKQKSLIFKIKKKYLFKTVN